ncbi:hypothetical protein CDAR_429571 [Caerostris darwini]|uniref:Uncharacterized protein n=1 Tax=Caerostris darwini TaxID=1538125 RepID=A0AAV4VVG9_9ARAC|nr:hypothetical protein CDAR_429571 [Caerostris darwini]
MINDLNNNQNCRCTGVKKKETDNTESLIYQKSPSASYFLLKVLIPESAPVFTQKPAAQRVFRKKYSGRKTQGTTNTTIMFTTRMSKAFYETEMLRRKRGTSVYPKVWNAIPSAGRHSPS